MIDTLPRCVTPSGCPAGARTAGHGPARTRARGARGVLAGVSLVLLVLSVSGCGEVGGRADTTAPPEPTASAPRTGAAPGPPAAAPPVEPSVEEAAAGLRPLLLVPAEIGPGFTPGDEPRPDPRAPAICGGQGVVAQFPHAVRVGAGFVGPAEGVFVQETVSVYGDAATAEAAFLANQQGLSCSQGQASGSPVVVTPAADLGADVPADRSVGWRIGGDGFDLVLIAARSGELVVNFAFVAPEGQAAGLPDPLVISRAGVEKLAG